MCSYEQMAFTVVGHKNVFVLYLLGTECMHSTSTSVSITFVILPGYGFPQYWTMQYWPTKVLPKVSTDWIWCIPTVIKYVFLATRLFDALQTSAQEEADACRYAEWAYAEVDSNHLRSVIKQKIRKYNYIYSSATYTHTVDHLLNICF